MNRVGLLGGKYLLNTTHLGVKQRLLVQGELCLRAEVLERALVLEDEFYISDVFKWGLEIEVP